MSSLLALLSAATYGAADFLGAVAAARSTTIASVISSQAAGLFLLAILLPLLPHAIVSPADIAWGGVAGLTGGAGVALLYRALAIGPMSVVAPLTALCAAAIPVAVGLAFGERLSTLTAAGIVLAAVAIILVGQPRPTGDSPPTSTSRHVSGKGVGVALAAGIAVGLFFVSLERTSAASGLWPLVPARIVAVGLFTVVALATRGPVLVPRSVMRVAVGGGTLDVLANALYLAAVQQGPLSVVATLASLYPASTVVLARVVLGERLSRLQALGIGAALTATLLIVRGAA